MKVELLAFGIAKDILKGNSLSADFQDGLTVGELKQWLQDKYPAFERLRAFSIAVNEEYRADDFVIQGQDEVVIIPPVSGG